MVVLQLGGVVLVGYVREDLSSKVENIGSGYEAVGAMGMANKGGIALSFRFNNTSICVVGTHLAAHQNEILKRNHNFEDIYNNITITSLNDPNAARPGMEKIADHNVIFWMGDLNYRIDDDDAVIRQNIRLNQTANLLDKDQLKAQQKTFPLLGYFQESMISFLPTYKFYPNTQKYSEKRKPAFCDRILFRDNQGLKINALEYTAVPAILDSDHRPVRGLFTIQTRQIKEKEYMEISKALIDQENALLRLVRPQVFVDTQELDIECYPYTTSEAVLTVRNSGKSKVKTTFRDYRVNKSNSFPEWFSVTPPTLELAMTDLSPHMFTFQFNFPMSVETAEFFGDKQEAEYNLILEIQNGNTLFINFHLRLRPTTFNKPIDLLNTRPKAFTQTQPPKCNPLVVPKEVWRLCDYLLPHLNDPNLLQTPPSNQFALDYKQILFCLDENITFPPALNHRRVVQFLALFLSTLRTPIIPSDFYDQVASSAERSDETLANFFIENKVPVCNQNLFNYVVSFLREMRDKNPALDHQTIARYFLPAFVRPADGPLRLCDRRSVEEFVVFFLRKGRP